MKNIKIITFILFYISELNAQINNFNFKEIDYEAKLVGRGRNALHSRPIKHKH